VDKLLNQFLAVAEAGTISGAATALLVTQPTLTFNMRKLEENMGVPLLIRSPRGVELTEYGETLYRNARLMRRLYDNTLDALAQQRGRTEEGLRIGTGYSWWTVFIRDFVIDYSRKYPNAGIHVSVGNSCAAWINCLAATSRFSPPTRSRVSAPAPARASCR